MYFGGYCVDLFCMHPRCAMVSRSMCSPPVAFECIVITLLGGAIRLCIVLLLSKKRNAWEFSVYLMLSIRTRERNLNSLYDSRVSKISLQRMLQRKHRYDYVK